MFQAVSISFIMQLFSILLATFYGNFYQFLRKMQKVCFEKYASKLQYFSLIVVLSLNCVTTSFVTYWLRLNVI